MVAGSGVACRRSLSLPRLLRVKRQTLNHTEAGSKVTAEGWALFSAFCFAGAHVTSKRGLQDTSVIAGSLIVLGTSWIVITVAVVADPPAAVTTEALVVYGALGLLVPAISRWAVLTSVDMLGPSIAIPIQQGLRPLLSVAGAILLLGESVDLTRLTGTAAIVAGGWQLAKRPGESGEAESHGLTAAAIPDRRTRHAAALRPGIVIPGHSGHCICRNMSRSPWNFGRST